MKKSLVKLLLLILMMFCLTGKTKSQKIDSIAPLNKGVKEIIVICKTHFDIGYTHRVKDLLQYYRTEMIDKALDIMDRTNDLPENQRFAWTAPGWVMEKVSEEWQGQTEERRLRIDKAFKTGRFVTHAVPFTLESESVFPEAIARGFAHSENVRKKYGLPISRGAKMTDVPSQGNVLATVLANGGVKFLHLGCNWPSGYVNYPALFWWEGPDGSRILTLYSHVYSTSVGLLTPDAWTNHFPRDRSIGRDLIPPSDWPYEVWPAIMVTPDNSGPPTAEKITSMFREAGMLLPGVKIRTGTLEDFADALLATNPNIPVVKKEAPDTWIHGYGCDPGGMKKFRNLQPLMPAFEVLDNQMRNLGIAGMEISGQVAKSYELSLLYAEHTWGGAASVNKYGREFMELPPSAYADLEGSWEDKTDYIVKADSIISAGMTAKMKALAQGINMRGKRFVVYNPLAWQRSGWVRLPGTDDFVFAKDVPACGYITFDQNDKNIKLKGDYKAADNTIENEFFKIVFDPAKGKIISLYDKIRDREWVDNDSELAPGQYLNERFTYEQTLEYVYQYQQGRAVNAFGVNGDWPHPGLHKPGMISARQVPYRAASPVKGVTETGSFSWGETLTVDFPANPENHLAASRLKITLFKGMPYADFEITIKDKPKDNWPEADWFCFPFRIEKPAFTVGRTLGFMDPLDGIMDGANKDLYAVGGGVSITGSDGSGITVCPLDHPLVSLDRPGIWKFSKYFIPQKPVVYVNLYNNQWNTNFRYWYPGTWSSRVRIWTFGNNPEVSESLQIPSMEARTPLLVAAAEGKAGTLPASWQGITLSRKGIEITSYKTLNSGGYSPGAVLFRLWEQAGKNGKVEVHLPGKIEFTKATPVNLRNEISGDPVRLNENSFEFQLGPYAPASFILER